MAPFPRRTLRKMLRTLQPDNIITGKAEVLVFLNFELFLKHLASEAAIEAQKGKSNVILKKHIQKALPAALQKFRG